MLCNYCGKNEADKTYIVNMMGGQLEVNVCIKCLEQMWKLADATGQRDAFVALSGWWPGKEEPKHVFVNEKVQRVVTKKYSA